MTVTIDAFYPFALKAAFLAFSLSLSLSHHRRLLLHPFEVPLALRMKI